MSEPTDASIDARVDHTIGDPVVWDEPPARLRSQLLATAAVERRRRFRVDPVREVATVPAEAVDGDQRADSDEQVCTDDQAGADERPDGRVVVLPRRSIRKALAVAAVVAALAVGIGVVVHTNAPDADVRLALVAPAGPSEVLGVAEFRPFPSGTEVTLRLEGLAAATPGTYYAVWLRGDDGIVPLGSFHLRNGGPDDVVLWSAVPISDFPTLVVTQQRVGEPPTPTDVVVLTGSFGDYP